MRTESTREKALRRRGCAYTGSIPMAFGSVSSERHCGFQRSQHGPGRAVEDHTYVPPRKDPARRRAKATRRSTAAYAKDAERRVANALNGYRLPTTGRASQPDVVVYVDGPEPAFAVECKQRKVPAWILAALQQAEHAAAGMTGRPDPMVALVDKPGQGRQGRILIVLDVAVMAQVVEGIKQ